MTALALRARRAMAGASLAALILPATPARSQPELVIHKPGTKEYHRPGCPEIRDGKGVTALTRAQAESRKLEPHPACDPEKQSGDTPAKPVYVYTDGGKYYHRENCKRLAADRERVALDEAGKEFWPCPVCKPPIRKRRTPAVPKAWE